MDEDLRCLKITETFRSSAQMMRRKFSPDSRASVGLFVKALTS
jgi:hypothetical protein